MDATAKKIQNLIEPALGSMGYDLVKVELVGSAGRPTLQIFAERHDKERIGTDDCSEISKTVSALLDVEDPISSAYMLEISSPGMDRPLIKLADYVRFKGHNVKLEAPFVIEDRKRYSGDIIDIKDDVIFIQDDEEQIFEIPFNKIEKAKLVLTDKLLNAYKNKEI